MRKKRAGDPVLNENTSIKVRRKRRQRNQILAMLIMLILMVAVMYLALCLFAWINERAERNAAPVFGSNVEDSSGEEGTEGGNRNPVRIEQNGNVVDEDGNIIGVLSNSVYYSQEELEERLASAKEQAAADVLESIRSGLSDGDTILQTLRPLYPDELIVYSGGKYNFVPINYDLKRHQLDEACLNVLESGEFQYIQDGQVISHKGIDVSRHQGTIDWELVAQDGVEFAFIRVGYRGYGTGKLVEDEYFEANIEGAIAAGIKVGVYFYSQAIDETELLEEADLVLNKIAPYQIDCPVVFDVEMVTGDDGRMNGISVEERTALTLLFCQTIENAGYRPMIYHNTEMGVMKLGLEALENYSKWFAAYSDRFYYPYEYAVWQYSQSGKVQGIKTDVDLNISFGPLWEE